MLVLQRTISLRRLPRRTIVNAKDQEETFRLLRLQGSLHVAKVHKGISAEVGGVRRRRLSKVMLTTTKLRQLKEASLVARCFRPRRVVPTTTRKALTLRLQRNSGRLSKRIGTLSSVIARRVAYTRQLFLGKAKKSYRVPVKTCTYGLPSKEVRLLKVIKDTSKDDVGGYGIFKRAPRRTTRHTLQRAKYAQ